MNSNAENGTSNAAPESGTLTIVEQAKLENCETVIEDGLQSFIAVGRALATIRDEKLYRATHTTFADYLFDRWGLKRQRAYELIDAAEVAKSVSEISDIRIERESHAAALADVAAEQRVEVLTKAKEATGGKITAKAIKAAAEPDAEDEDDLSWRNGHVADFQPTPPGKTVVKATKAASTKPTTIKLTDKERKVAIHAPGALFRELNKARKRIINLRSAIGYGDEDLAEVERLVIAAFKLVDAKRRGWEQVHNKREGK